jgi:hypothetical protein
MVLLLLGLFLLKSYQYVVSYTFLNFPVAVSATKAVSTLTEDNSNYCKWM